MTEEFIANIIQAADEIITLSSSLDSKMETWGDILKRRGETGDVEAVGFINKTTAEEGVNIIVDVHISAEKNEAVLRTYCIESSLGSDGTELFNNIALDFVVNYARAHQLVLRGSNVTRDDIRTLLHDKDTTLAHILVSDKSGVNAASQQLYGECYDFAAAELNETVGTDSKVRSALQEVLAALKQTATQETERNYGLTMSETLADKAKILKDSKLFINPSDDAPLLDKQNILLVLAGKKQISDVSTGHWEQISPTERTRRGDDPAEVSALLDSLGLQYRLRTEEWATIAEIALTKANLDQYKKASATLTGDEAHDAAIHVAIGRMYGYPQSAAEAFANGDTLDSTTQQDLIHSANLPNYFAGFFFSKDHYREEIALLQEWYKLLGQYELV